MSKKKHEWTRKGVTASMAVVLAFGMVPAVPGVALAGDATEVSAGEPDIARLSGGLLTEYGEIAERPSDLNGDGSETSPYLVNSVDHLVYALTVGGCVELGQDINAGSLTPDGQSVVAVATVPENIEVKLDLNGHAISAGLNTNGSNYSRAHVILNNGSLNIVDSSSGHTGSIENTNNSSNACTRTVKNNAGAKLVINGGTISGTVALLNLGDCTIDGENVVIKSEANFDGGGWNNSSAAIEHRSESGMGELTIVNVASVSSISRAAVFCDAETKFSIQGGIFVGNPSYGAINGNTADSMASITGGFFSSDPTYLIDQKACVVVNDSSGYYEVVKLGLASPVTVASEGELRAALEQASYEAPLDITLNGEVVLNSSAELRSGSTLTIASGASLTVSKDATLFASGLIYNAGILSVEGFMTNPLNLTNNGVIVGLDFDAENYEVKTAMDFQWLTYLVEYGNVRHVTLTHDITMPDGVEFQMIGEGTKGFYGNSDLDRNTFNGQGHSIKGLNFSSDSSQAGIFTSLRFVDVKNVTIEVDAEANTAFIGGVTGYAVEGVTFQGVVVKGDVKVSGGSYGCAGIAAVVGLDGTNSSGNAPIYFIGCRNEAAVGGANGYNVGSMFGTAEGSDDSIFVYNCSNSGPIAAQGSIGYVFGYGHLGESAALTIIGFDNSGKINGEDGEIGGSSGGGYEYSIANAGSEYMASRSADGAWSAVLASDVVAMTDGSAYVDFDAAVLAMEDGSLTKVVKPVEIDGSIVIEKDVALTGLDNISIADSGSLVISSGCYDVDPSMYVSDNRIVKREGSSDSYVYVVVAKSNLAEGTYMEDPTGFVAENYEVVKNDDETWSVVYAEPSPNPPAGGGSTAPSEPEGEVTENEDGSTTTTVTEDDGSSVETTVSEDEGVTTVVEKDGDGAVTSVSATVTEEAVEAAGGKAVALPFAEPIEAASSDEAVEIEVQAPAGAKVAVPVAKAEGADSVAPGAVLVLVDAEGDETVLPKTANTGDALAAEIPGDCTLKVVDASADFPDVASDDWYEEQGVADFVSARGIMTGVEVAPGSFEFQGDEPTNRGMFVTMLNRLEMEAKAVSGEGFADVPEGSWYEDSSAWAVEAGIATGYLDAEGNATFDGEGEVTREQMATFLFRYAQWLGLDTDARAEGEIEGASDFAKDAVSWAVAEGLIKGDDETGAIRPGDGATRAEAAAVVMRMIELMA